MTNAITIAILVALAALLLVDHYWIGLDLPLFLARELDWFIEYLSFWR